MLCLIFVFRLNLVVDMNYQKVCQSILCQKYGNFFRENRLSHAKKMTFCRILSISFKIFSLRLCNDKTKLTRLNRFKKYFILCERLICEIKNKKLFNSNKIYV
jgi:hypothetical protein